MYRVLILLVTATMATACAPRVVRVPHSLPPSVQLKRASLGRVWVAGFATTPTSELDVNTEPFDLFEASCAVCRRSTSSKAQPVAIDSEQGLRMCRIGGRSAKNMVHR